MGVIVERTEGREIMIGNHTVVSILGIDNFRGNNRVKLNIDSMEKVSRVDNAKTIKEAANIKTAASRVAARRGEPMRDAPVYFLHDGAGELSAATLDSGLLEAVEGGMESRKIVKPGDLRPTDPSITVIRVTAERDAKVLKKVMPALVPQLELRSTIQHRGDGMHYMLFLQRGDTMRLTRIDAAT